MPRPSPRNERIKRAYLRYLREARGRSEKTLNKVAADLYRFESFTGGRDFKRFRNDNAEAFKRALCEQVNKRTGEPLSKSTVMHVTVTLRDFFRWLSTQPGYRSLSPADADYFNLSARDTRIGRETKEKNVPTLAQIAHCVACAPATSEVERRDRAVIAFALLTGARDGAIVTFKLKHIDLIREALDQDAREVQTKASKTFTTSFFPVGDEVHRIVVEWVQFLIKEKMFGPDEPIFPGTKVDLVKNKFTAVGISRLHWSSAAPIRKIFKVAFERAGLPYFNPHSFRSTLGLLGQQVCRNPEEFKAWSQNLGHESPLTTLTSYGKVNGGRQAEVMCELRRRRMEGPSPTIEVAALMQYVKLQARQSVDL
jgi:integrase